MRTRKLQYIAFVCICALGLSQVSVAAVNLVTKEGYRQQSDSPWITDILSGQGHLEDFEDNQFNLPNASGGTEIRISTVGPLTAPGAGVDFDDGMLDGVAGLGSRFLTSTNALSVLGQTRGNLNVRFSLNSSGQLPKRVGFALLAVGNLPSTLTAYAADGSLLYQQSVVVPSSLTSPEDATRVFFVGLESDIGIASFHFVGNGFDHFQFSYIPEPSTVGLLGLAALWQLRRRRVK